ncbi:hypothetical protein CARUB_v10027603mg, partial [Capsella rubella]
MKQKQLWIVVKPKVSIGVGSLCSLVAMCYHVLSLVHEIWKPIPRTPNGYQSLHTTVKPFLYESITSRKGTPLLTNAYLIHTEIESKIVAAKVFFPFHDILEIHKTVRQDFRTFDGMKLQVNGYLVSPTHILENVDVVETVTYNILYLFSHAFFFHISFSFFPLNDFVADFDSDAEHSRKSLQWWEKILVNVKQYTSREKGRDITTPTSQNGALGPKGIMSKVTTVLAAFSIAVCSCLVALILPLNILKGLAVMLLQIEANIESLVDLLLGWSSCFSWPKSTDNAQVLE